MISKKISTGNGSQYQLRLQQNFPRRTTENSRFVAG
jgi:hypothetical protein